MSAAHFSASVNLFALTGESGNSRQTRAPIMIVRTAMARKKMRQLANDVLAKLTPYASTPPRIWVSELQT